MKLLAFSDLHCDLEGARSLVERSRDVDIVIGAGDFASVHRGLEATIDALAEIEAPTILIPGNNETDEALSAARSAAKWDAATVLHGDLIEIEGVSFFGLGGGIPTTPWDWSFDLTEDEACEALSPCPDGAILVVHSPPHGHCDRAGSGDHLGSESIGSAIEAKRPALVVCGHIHEAWGERSVIGGSQIANLGPVGAEFEI